jgi:putative membrane protein
MIQYDPHHWRSHLFDIRGSMVREIFARITVCVLWAVIVVTVHKAGQTPVMSLVEDGREIVSGESQNLLVALGRTIPLSIPLHGHTLIGVALGLLLVFRTNVSYDRFWEGRRQWGNIINDSRNIARLATSLLKEDRDLLDRLLLWTMAWSWSVKYRLRGKQGIGSIATELPASEVQEVEQAQHLPLAVSRKMTEQIVAAQRRGLISDVQQSLLDASVQRLIDALGACERIHNTPLPFAYMVHLRRALIVYLATLPMALVADFGWATVPAILLIAYIMLGVEEIGVEIEDPFGDDVNDLPLTTLCETITNNLQSLRPGQRVNPQAPQLDDLKQPE